MRLSASQKVILGPPGCGKTTRLLALVEQYIAEGTPPERMAYFSFTKKAVDEARTRAAEKFGFEKEQLVYFRTVHSMVFSLNHHKRSEVLGREHFREIGASLGIEFGNGYVDESTGLPSVGTEGDKHLFISGLARARRVSLKEQWESVGKDIDYWAVERTVTAVENYKKAHNLVDFSGMLEKYERSGQPINVDVAFVDEAQDLSALQWAVLKRMLSRCSRVVIAGDDDQAIYRWSGADVKTFLSLEGGQEALTQSWRCPAIVHKVAGKIVGRISQRFDKKWQPKAEPGTLNQINSLETFDFAKLEGTSLLLARNTYLLNKYTDELRKRGLAFTTSWGAHSVNFAHARAVYAYTRLRKGESVKGADAKLIYDQLRVGIGVKRGFKSLNMLGDDVLVNLADLKEKYGLLADTPWYDALDGISGADRAYYRSILRGGGNLVAKPTIAVNTVHGVKGGEADNVVVIPDLAWATYQDYEKTPDDEHRVAYVAVSRAKKNLYVVTPESRNFYRYLD